MYLWNINQLAKDLKENVLSESKKVTYLFLYFFLLGISGFSGLNKLGQLKNIIFAPQLITFYHLAYSIDWMIFFIGLYLAYRKNQEGDNKNFIERYFCLALPLCFRSIIYRMLAFISGMILLAPLGLVIGFIKPEHQNIDFAQLPVSTHTYIFIISSLTFWVVDIFINYLLIRKMAYISGVRQEL